MTAATPPLPPASALFLRPPQPLDYRRLAAWIPDADTCDRWAGPSMPYPLSSAELEQRLSPDDRRRFALTDPDGSFWGFAQSWQEHPPAWHLGRLIVAPEARGHGYGRRLCELLIAAHDGTHQALTLRVRRDNIVAHTLYLDLGFCPSEPESTPMALFMRRPPSALRQSHTP